MNTNRDALVAAINASGLWASYGAAAPLLGFGNSPRACANANWEMNARLARRDGTTNAADATKGERWVAEHPAAVLIDSILGYHTSAGGPHLHYGGAMPQELRLRKRDLRALAGLEPSTVDLRLRVSEQALRLEEWLDSHPRWMDAYPGEEHRRAVVVAFAEATALHQRLVREAK
jgi:hypothetical protein